jgi:uncharacterized repeat protein (TIGR01451 family)
MRRILLLLAVLCLPTTAFAQLDTLGTDFWLTFPGNHADDDLSALSLFITSNSDTSGTVSIPGLSFSQPFTVNAGTITTIVIPLGAELETSDVVGNLGIHVTSAEQVAIYGLNRQEFTTDAYLGLPSDILGTDYYVMSYSVSFASQFAIVGTQNGTVVTITPTAAAGARLADVPYAITLDQGETYQLRSGGDLTGSHITSTAPVAVFGSERCTTVPPGTGFCDYIVEQIPPTDTWGERFVTVPLATRTAGDIFRVLASESGTTVAINGATVATLAEGDFFETSLSTASVITSNNPVLTAQYSKGSQADGTNSDPFMMLITPAEQFLDSYVITTPASGFPNNFVNLVVPNGATGTVTIDGSSVPAASFTAVGSSGYSGAAVPIAIGSHVVEADQPFGVFVYGFADDDSYGYPGGGLAAPVAAVNTITLAPAAATTSVGQQHCVTATVRNTLNQPVEGVRVDFTVSGANSSTGFALTNASGLAQFCYTGTNAGPDTITAAVGTITATATNTYVASTLTVTKTAPATTTQGSSLTYTLTVNNTGAVAANGVIVRDTIPAGTTFLSATNGGVNNSGVVVFNLGTVAAGATRTVSFTVNVFQSGTVTNSQYSVEGTGIPATGGAPVVTAVAAATTDVPTVSQWGLLLLAFGLAFFAVFRAHP